MHINREKIGVILEEQLKRNWEDKGYQPSLSLGCFYSLSSDRTEAICEKCRSYAWTCSTHLKAFEIKDRPFEKHKQEIYEKRTGQRSDN